MATVAFCPTDTDINPHAKNINLQIAPYVISPPPAGARWITHVAAQLAGTADSLILVFSGQTSQYAPALGFSRKALRSPAVGYILIDPVMPSIGGDYGDWPDAPVTIVLTEVAPEFALDAARQAKLRGWEVTREQLAQILH
ncbi:MAG: hypothetical protein EBS36_04370 [Actinobacteria bacterium]|nr:hypothetical protein [Actinomycetota bacterium]NBY15461.1 hypothetical protein [Actinomycetota bacterium]